MNYAKKAWKASYSSGVPTRPGRLGGGLHIPLPGPSGYLGYVHTHRPILIDRRGWNANLKIVFTVQVILSADAEVVDHVQPSAGGMAPHVRPFLLRDMTTDNGRWWSADQAIDIVAGTHRIVVDLSPAVWTNVSGDRASSTNGRTNAFKSFADDWVQVGFTAGAGNHFGHGIELAAGTGSLIVHAYTV